MADEDAAAQLHPVLQHHIANSLGWPDLRPLQKEAVGPLLRGEDALLLAPTAGGKTEAAIFPLLSRMATDDWRGLTVLYVCPLRALLNNLEPRLNTYAGWLGRRVGLRHGDTSASVRRRLATDRPDILLTTPESLEAMLVSTLLTPSELFADLRTVVVDEVHAFAGDDRGWHLLAVLERLARLAGRPLQRVGLSATVGDAEGLLEWLQGSGHAEHRPATIVAPDALSVLAPELQLDYVGTVDNAATVVSALHRGEKRLVFADSRRTVESLATGLRERHTETFVSHSSLSVDERRRAETAFSEARDCVIVSTSTLELGIDVGDLDRVVQVGAPGSVASLLQRMGRTGRRPGTARSMLFLATDEQEFLRAAGLLLLWGEGFVEPVTPPPAPRHVLSQQLIALCLQEGRVGESTWQSWFSGLPLASAGEAEAAADWLVETGHLDVDGGMLFVGPEAERRYGNRNFMDLLSVFTSDPQFLILHGRNDIGAVDPMVLTRKIDGPRVISLAGRSWEVTYIDWKRRRAFVEPSKQTGSSRWSGMAQPQSFALTDAMRRVVLGAELTGVSLTRRGTDRLVAIREDLAPFVSEAGTVASAWDKTQMRWWTWAGARANAVLSAAVAAVEPGIIDERNRYDNRYIALRGDATASELSSALRHAGQQFGEDLARVEPTVSAEAVKQLKFAELLPPGLAAATLAARAADHEGARAIAGRPIVSA